MGGKRLNSDVITVDASLVFRLLIHNPSQLTVQQLFEQWIREGKQLYCPKLVGV